LALRLRDIFTHPSRRDRAIVRSTGRKDSRALALDNSTRIGAVGGYGIASVKFKDYDSYLRAYKLPWVRACVQVISYNAANVSFRLVKPDGGPDTTEEDDEEVLDSPFLNLLNHPNPYQTGFSLREAWWTDLELTGNAYISLEGTNPRGLPTELYRLNPSRVTVLPDRERFIAGYRYTVNGRSVDYLPEEIIHLKYANPLDDFYGMGVIEAGEARFESEMAMAIHERNFWQSGAKITGLFGTDESLDDSTFTRLTDRFRSFFQGSGYSTMLLENGLKYTSVSDGPAKLGMLEMAHASRDQIFAMFGVPATKVGILERANYKADEADRFFWTESIDPKLTRVEDGIQPLVEMFHPGSQYRLRFKRLNFTDDLPQMQVAETMSKVGVFTADEIRQYTGRDPLPANGDVLIAQVGIVPLDLAGPMATVNERRKDQGLPPIDGGDAFIILPARSVPLDVSTGEVATPSQQGPQTGPTAVPGARPSNVVQMPVPATPAPAVAAGKAVQRVSVARPATAHLAQQHRTRAVERGLAVHKPALETFFGEQEKRVKARLAAVPKRQKAALAEGSWWDDAEEDDALGGVIGPLWSDALVAGVTAARQLGVPVLAESDARMAQLKQGLGDRITNINATTREAVAAQITEGLRRGYSSAQLATGVLDEDFAGVSGVFEDARGYRSVLIARTEMSHAYLQANLDTFQQSGVVGMVEAQDGTVDEECADRNGEVMSVEDAMSIEDHPNGILNWIPLVDS
jgi:HK97 family phage portal protein